ncbi:MAG: flagellar biosynthesis protein FlhF [Planctomycetota bacterium]
MAVKTFNASSWEDALASVKRELGEHAVIISSKTTPQASGSSIEITASNDAAEIAKATPRGTGNLAQKEERNKAGYARLVEKAYALTGTASGPSQPTAPTSSSSNENVESLKRDVSELKSLIRQLANSRGENAVASFPEHVQNVFESLKDNDVSPEVARRLCSAVHSRLSGDQLTNAEVVQAGAQAQMAELIPCSGPITLNTGRSRTVAFVGPTGVGKTTTLSKLAANFKLKDHATVGFITVDTYRLGATEQLKTLASILEVPVRIVMTPGEIRAAMAELRDRDIVFIDTAGRSPRDRMRINELRAFLDAAEPDETHLVVSATTHPRHLDSLLDRFGGDQIQKLVLTKLDEAASYGPTFDVILGANKPLSYITTGQDIPDDIEVADPNRISRLVLGLDELVG